MDFVRKSKREGSGRTTEDKARRQVLSGTISLPSPFLCVYLLATKI
jgi:hypothetical protein